MISNQSISCRPFQRASGRQLPKQAEKNLQPSRPAEKTPAVITRSTLRHTTSRAKKRLYLLNTCDQLVQFFHLERRVSRRARRARRSGFKPLVTLRNLVVFFSELESNKVKGQTDVKLPALS